MKRLLLIALSLFVLYYPDVSAQNATAKILHYNEHPGEVVVPILVSGFIDITSITIYFFYDPDVLSYTGTQNAAIPGLILGSNPVPGSNLYKFAISWQASGFPYTVNGTLIEIIFDYIAGTSDLTFDAANNEVSDINFLPISVDYINGSIAPPVQVSIPETDPQLPGSVLIPLNVDFSVVNQGVGDFEFLIEYDPEVLSLITLKNYAISGISFEILSPAGFSISRTGAATQFNGKLLEMEFEFYGGSSEITFTESFCNVSNSVGNEVAALYNNGLVNEIQVSLELSTITAIPTQINLCETSEITVQLKSTSGENINGSAGTVTLETTLGNLSAVTDNLNGTYAAILTPGTPYETGLAIITGKLDGNNFENEAIVEFLAAPELLCPGDVVASNDPGQCGAEISFSASVSGYPASTLTYHIGETTIDSPHFFPVGTTFVLTKATFECGVLTCIFSVTVADSEPPVVAVNGFSAVACLSQAVEPAVPDAADNCDGIIEGEFFSITDNPDPILCEGERVYSYSYIDEANNISYWTYTYTIEYEDFTMPDDGGETITCPADIYTPTPPTVYDNCGDLITNITGPVVSEIPECEGAANYVWTYTDCAGNSHDWIYTFTIEYEDFTLPNNGGETIACASDLYTPTPPTVYDNCGNLITNITGPVVSEIPECEGVVNYVWTYTDCAGHSHEWTYTFTILPTTGPELIDQNIACSSLNQGNLEWSLEQAEGFDASALEADVTALYQDNCGGSVTVSLSNILPGENNNDQSWSFAYVFAITDICGNLIFCTVEYSGGIESGAPDEIDLPNRVVNEGDDFCFGANQTIIVQNGLTVNGGSITLIAGTVIHLLPGVVVHGGGTLHAYISNTLCANPTPLISAKENPVLPLENFSLTQHQTQIKIYPNPVVRVLTVDLTNEMEAGLVRIEIINIIGEQLTRWELFGKNYYELDMTGIPTGIYILQIFDGKQIINHKLIKQ